MTSTEWAASITALAIAIAEGKSPEEIAFLGTIFTQLADTLTTLSVSPPELNNKHN